MRFTLVYDGPLPAQSADSRLRDKHAIREKFHEQLRELWETTPVLRVDWRKWRALSQTERAELTESRPRSKSTLVQEFVVGRFSFVPLVTKVHRLLAELDILFLRREPTGSLFTTNKAGDLDNRLKVLFDALRLPRDPKEIGDASLQPTERQRPFFCLLEDDDLITAVRLESERLYETSVDQPQNDVRLIVRVNVKVQELSGKTLALVD